MLSEKREQGCLYNYLHGNKAKLQSAIEAGMRVKDAALRQEAIIQGIAEAFGLDSVSVLQLRNHPKWLQRVQYEAQKSMAVGSIVSHISFLCYAAKEQMRDMLPFLAPQKPSIPQEHFL